MRGRVEREPVARNVSGAAPARGSAALLQDGIPAACGTASSSSSQTRLRLESGRTGPAAVEFVSPSLASSFEVLEIITVPSAIASDLEASGMAPAADGKGAGDCGRKYCVMLCCDAGIRAGGDMSSGHCSLLRWHFKRATDGQQPVSTALCPRGKVQQEHRFKTLNACVDAHRQRACVVTALTHRDATDRARAPHEAEGQLRQKSDCNRTLVL